MILKSLEPSLPQPHQCGWCLICLLFSRTGSGSNWISFIDRTMHSPYHDSIHCIISLPPSQKARRVAGNSRPITLPFASNRAPFSRSATIKRGIAAAVPLSVCAKPIELVLELVVEEIELGADEW